MEEEEEARTTRIFLLRSSNHTAIMITSLIWKEGLILKEERIEFENYHQKAFWFEGELLMTIDDYLEKTDFGIEQLIRTLNKFEIPAIGYQNDLLQLKLTAGFSPIIVDFEITEEYREIERQEIRDITNHLFNVGRLINQSDTRDFSPLFKDCLAIAVKTFKKDLMTNRHYYNLSPSLSPSSKQTTNIGQEQIRRILLEPSQYNLKGRQPHD